MNKKVIIAIVAFLALFAGGIYLLSGKGNTTNSTQPGKYDQLAQCLKDNGAIFYGAFWCPHCQNTKAEFGSSAKSLPYVECSTPDGQGQLDVCKTKNIQSYPTWEFKDGSRLTGEISVADLAKKAGCNLPQ